MSTNVQAQDFVLKNIVVVDSKTTPIDRDVQKMNDVQYVDSLDINTSYFWSIKTFKKQKDFFESDSTVLNQQLFQNLNDYLKNVNSVLRTQKEPFFLVNSKNEFLEEWRSLAKPYLTANAKDEDLNYSYKIQLNPNFSTNYFIKGLDLFISLDQNTQLIHHGIALNFNMEWCERNHFNCPKRERLLSSMYINHLFQSFFDELIEHFSFYDWVNLLKDGHIHNLHHLQIFLNDAYEYTVLEKKWINFSYEKFFYKLFDEKSKYLDFGKQLIQNYLCILLIVYGLAENLRHFWYKLPINHFVLNQVQNHDSKQRLVELAKYLNRSLVIAPRNKKLLSVVFNLTKNETFLSHGYAFYTCVKTNNPTNNFKIDVFNKFALFPEELNFDLRSCYFGDFDEMLSTINDLKSQDNYYVHEETEKFLVLHNAISDYYVKNLNGLLIFEQEPSLAEKNANLKDAYFLSCALFSKQLQYRLVHDQWHFALNGKNIRSKFLFGRVNQQLDDLESIPEYAMRTPTLTVQFEKLQNRLFLTEDVKRSHLEVRDKEEFDRRQRFIEIIIVGYIVSSLISLIDYGNMVWSTLSCAATGYGLPYRGATPVPTNYPGSMKYLNWHSTLSPPGQYGGSSIHTWLSSLFVAGNTFVILINTTILIVSCIYLIYAATKNKKIAQRMEVSL